MAFHGTTSSAWARRCRPSWRTSRTFVWLSARAFPQAQNRKHLSRFHVLGELLVNQWKKRKRIVYLDLSASWSSSCTWSASTSFPHGYKPLTRVPRPRGIGTKFLSKKEVKILISNLRLVTYKNELYMIVPKHISGWHDIYLPVWNTSWEHVNWKIYTSILLVEKLSNLNDTTQQLLSVCRVGICMPCSIS